MVAKEPRLLNPTLVPTWRTPTTANTPGQLAGSPTLLPALPADATIRTPCAVISFVAVVYMASQGSSEPRLMLMICAGVGLTGGTVPLPNTAGGGDMPAAQYIAAITSEL